MKFDKKYIVSGTLIAVIVMALALILVLKQDDDNKNPLTNPSPSPTGKPIPTPTVTPTIQMIQKPKGELIITEQRTYQSWFEELDEKNRALAIYEECRYIVPSNVSYDNNTVVMLDNSRSSQIHILKIGSKEYLLEAGEWNIVTLNSPSVPVDLPIFCENIELGSIRLE